MTLPDSLKNNKTLAILRDAEAGGYGVCVSLLLPLPLGSAEPSCWQQAGQLPRPGLPPPACSPSCALMVPG